MSMCFLFVGVCKHACLHVFFLANLCAFSNRCFTEACYVKKQITAYEKETAILQAQVETLEANSAEKDTLIAKYEAIVKESEGENIGQYQEVQ